jgi:uncharacterized DUF497 family protein
VRFEWDESKNRRNIRKHGIDFIDAVDVFNHPMLTLLDARDDYEEDRWHSIGWIQLLIGVVVYTEREGDIIRIISARKATQREIQRYEESFKN